MSIYVVANAVQSIADIVFFKDVAYALAVTWRIIKLICRVIGFILGALFGAAVPLTILLIGLRFFVGD